MALKDIWQQDRQTRQAELKVRQQTVAQLRSQHQSEHAAMTAELRAELSQVLPKLRLDESDRQLEAQCAQAGREIEAAERRQEVQAFLYDLHQLRCVAADDLRLLLEEFRSDRHAQSAAIDLMLQETRKTRETEVAALFERFAEEKLDRQAAVQAIRDYVWGSAAPTPVTAEAIEAILSLAAQESPAKLKAKPSIKSEAKPAVVEPIVEFVLEPVLERSLTEKLLATVNSLSGVRLSDLESTLSVSRSELVQSLQQLIRSGDIVQRDRAYYARTQPSKAQIPASAIF